MLITLYLDSGQDEGIHMPRGQRGGHPTLAKSLPVSVPSFPSFVRRTVQDQDDDQVYVCNIYIFFYNLNIFLIIITSVIL